jgi:dephospho-CoA kinase
VIAIGLTGGIGSGKSTVARLLARHGARVIDADAIAHDAMFPGTAVFQAIVERFGPSIIGPDDAIDRAALAEVVFADVRARRDLEAIVHPAVGATISSELGRARADGVAAVVEIPLLVETDAKRRYGLDVIVVVDAPDDLVFGRLRESRGMDEAAVRARVAVQTERSARRAVADVIIENFGTLGELADMVERVWQWIVHFGPGSAPLDLKPGDGLN